MGHRTGEAKARVICPMSRGIESKRGRVVDGVEDNSSVGGSRPQEANSAICG